MQDFLGTLSDDLIYRLIMITKLTRGEFSADDMAGHYHALKETVGEPAEVIRTMMWDKTILADELLDGLEELRKHKMDVDKLPLKKVKVRKS